MTTRPRMSAPIGRLRINTGKTRRRRASGAGPWRPTDPPTVTEATEVEETPPESTHPPYYPFAPRRSDGDG